MGSIALVTPDASFEADLTSALPDLGPGGYRRCWREEYLRVDPTKMVADVTDGGADVVCIGPGLEPRTAIAFADAFDRERPELCVLLVAEPTAELVRDALRVGVRDVVEPTGGGPSAWSNGPV
ncbi:MAG: hypothetical protein ABIW46_09705, partial [Acidimicrobiales bacterium]